MTKKENSMILSKDLEGHLCAPLYIEGVKFTFYPDWYPNEGERWEFTCSVFANGEEYDSLRSSRPHRQEIVWMFEFYIGLGVITSVSRSVVDSVVESIVGLSRQTAPDCDAHDSYFGY